MDEPLSNLDAKLRVQMRAEISRIQRDLGVTTIYVTHDQVEAMTMGDRVAVMRKGELQQVDEPQTLYDRPRQPLRRRLHRLAGDEHARGDGRPREREPRRVDVGEPEPRRSARRRDRARRCSRTRAGRSILGIRPEHLEDAALAPDTPADAAAARTRRAARGARLRADGALHRRGRARGGDRGDEGARPRRGRRPTRERRERRRALRRPLRRARARRRGRAGRGRGRHERAAFLRSRDRSRDLRPCRTKGAAS